MDAPELDERAHHEALRGLARLNWLSRTARTFWRQLVRLTPETSRSPLRVLDVACGGGDIAIRLARIARRSPIEVSIDGCDISTRAIRFAAGEAARWGVPCRFFPLDVVAEPLPHGYDAFICSLFLHHLSEDEVLALLAKMVAASNRGFVIDDLHRSVGGYLLAEVVGRVVSRSPVVHHDGPCSVRAAFTIEEMRRLLDRAGLSGFSLRRCFPCRFLLSWRKGVADGR